MDERCLIERIADTAIATIKAGLLVWHCTLLIEQPEGKPGEPCENYKTSGFLNRHGASKSLSALLSLFKRDSGRTISAKYSSFSVERPGAQSILDQSAARCVAS